VEGAEDGEVEAAVEDDSQDLDVLNSPSTRARDRGKVLTQTQVLKRLYSSMSWQSRTLGPRQKQEFDFLKGCREKKQMLARLFLKEGRNLNAAIEVYTEHASKTEESRKAGFHPKTQLELESVYGKAGAEEFCNSERAKGRFTVPPGMDRDTANPCFHIFSVHTGVHHMPGAQQLAHLPDVFRCTLPQKFQKLMRDVRVTVFLRCRLSLSTSDTGVACTHGRSTAPNPDGDEDTRLLNVLQIVCNQGRPIGKDASTLLHVP
jgi:hypothetical protein